MMQKKSQGGANAAILVAIIATLIIVYIIFLPSAQRDRLLENKTGSKTSSEEESQDILLRVFPGTLSVTKGLESQKGIPDVFLVETTTAKEIKKINPFIVRNSLFDKRDSKMSFELEDPENTDNVLLSFTTKSRQGVLTIILNGAVIFESEITASSIEPIKLDKSNLQRSNTLEFSVSSVGLRFWTTNEYSFDNMGIIADITDTSRQESTNIFTLTDSEFKSIEKANLRFVPYCGAINDLGMLDIFVNNKKVFSSVPICDNLYRQSIPKSVLSEGENNIVFKTSRGSYSVEQIKVDLEFKEPVVKTYYFEISKDTFNSIRNGKKDLEITIKFADSGTKRAKLDINGHAESIETDKAEFVKNIESKISEGNNFVRLEPFDDLEVVELRIEMV